MLSRDIYVNGTYTMRLEVPSDKLTLAFQDDQDESQVISAASFPSALWTVSSSGDNGGGGASYADGATDLPVDAGRDYTISLTIWSGVLPTMCNIGGLLHYPAQISDTEIRIGLRVASGLTTKIICEGHSISLTTK